MLALVLNTAASSQITFDVITEDDSARGELSCGTLCTLSPPLHPSFSPSLPPPSLSLDLSLSLTPSLSPSLSCSLSLPFSPISELAISLRNNFVSALAPGDYEPINSTVSIPAGRTEYIISLLVKADNITEDPESFTLRLLNPSDGVSLGYSMATVNIVDLDGTYTKFVTMKCFSLITLFLSCPCGVQSY